MITLPPDKQAALFPGVSFADYCAIPAVNISSLLKLSGVTDCFGKWAMDHPGEETRALRVGHALHASVLEPEVFASMYCAMPEFGDLRTTKARDAKAVWAGEHQGFVHMKPDEYADAIGMRDRLAQSQDPEIIDLMTGPGLNELTILFIDPVTKLLCKARLDRTTLHYGYNTLLDLKTGESIYDRDIETELAARSYHVRLAWYMDALAMVHPGEWMAVLLWCYSRPPYECRATQCDEHAYTEGRAAYRVLLDRYAKCVETGIWPSFRPGIAVINPAKWAYRFTTPML